MDGFSARPRFAEISTAFPTVPESVGAARRFVAASLRRFDFSDDALERAVLVTSELVAHACTTGRPPIRIRVRSMTDGRALVEVTHEIEHDGIDEGTTAECRQLSPAGRAVVESMSSQWGIRPSGGGVLAWFEADDVIRAETGPGSAASGRA